MRETAPVAPASGVNSPSARPSTLRVSLDGSRSREHVNGRMNQVCKQTGPDRGVRTERPTLTHRPAAPLVVRGAGGPCPRESAKGRPCGL